VPVQSSMTGIKVPFSSGEIGVLPMPWPQGAALLTGARPRVIVSSHPELIETPPAAGQLQELAAAPVAISGQLDAPNQEDRYRLPVIPGASLRFDVLAMRTGSPVDGVLTILNEQGGALGSSDDRPGTSDPGMDVVVPAGVNAVIVSLRDLRGIGAPGHVYRISATPVAQPDFRLSVDERAVVSGDGAALLRVRAERSNYNGPIKLSFPGLPPTIAASGLEIPTGATQALVSLTATAVTPAVLTSVVGNSDDPQVTISKTADAAANVVTRQQPWLGKQLALATGPAGAVQVAWEATPTGDLKLGMPVAAKAKINRAAGVTGAVRFSLVTTQLIPKKTVKVNNVDQQVDDTDKALRLDNPPTLAEGQNEADLKILVPGDLPQIPYDLAIQAELLAADGKTVAATATTPAVRLKAVP
jgi:hypothetical protein